MLTLFVEHEFVYLQKVCITNTVHKMVKQHLCWIKLLFLLPYHYYFYMLYTSHKITWQKLEHTLQNNFRFSLCPQNDNNNFNGWLLLHMLVKCTMSVVSSDTNTHTNWLRDNRHILSWKELLERQKAVTRNLWSAHTQPFWTQGYSW